MSEVPLQLCIELTPWMQVRAVKVQVAAAFVNR